MQRSWALAFLRLTRPLFLLGGALAYGLGAAVADAQGVTLRWGAYLLGQGLVTTIQLTAQYVNEYFDADVDRSAGRTWFSGGSGVLPAGLLPRMTALRAGQASTGAAAIMLVPVAVAEPAAGAAAAIALAVAWAYSAPPARLVGTGFGELAASLVVAGLVPLAGVWVNGGTADATLGWMMAALIGIHFSMIVAFSIPDVATDRAGGKRTLAVRLGPRRTRLAHLAGLAIAAATIALGAASGGLPIEPALWSLVALPPAIVQVVAVRRGAAAYRLSTVAAVATFVLVTAGFLLGTTAS